MWAGVETLERKPSRATVDRGHKQEESAWCTIHVHQPSAAATKTARTGKSSDDMQQTGTRADTVEVQMIGSLKTSLSKWYTDEVMGGKNDFASKAETDVVQAPVEGRCGIFDSVYIHHAAVCLTLSACLYLLYPPSRRNREAAGRPSIPFA